jgi:predicted O-methyltransferase YrrM
MINTEDSNREDAQRFVHALYRGMLRREPDPAAAEYYVDEILRGRTHATVAEEFLHCEEFKIQNSVKLFVPPGHFYSPITDPIEAERHVKSKYPGSLPDHLPGISLDRTEMISTWKNLLPFLQTIPFSGRKVAQFRYHFDNPGYSWGDGSILHAMLRLHRPKRVIEVGSGWSSACMIDTIENYLEGACDVTFVDPFPHLLRAIIRDLGFKFRILEIPIQQVPQATFDILGSGDILFVDSTHVLRTGSDVCFELFDVLPRLARGVLVHFHDIFWPFEYPRQWIVEENRSWNEIYAVRAFLSYNDAWRIVFFNDYVAKYEADMIENTYAQFMLNSGGALWLQRR